MEDASRSLKAISHPLRLKILCVLGEGELSVQDILFTVGTTQSNVSQHLCLLKDKGVVKSRKDANRVYYSIKDETIKKILGNH
ncbi:MAG: metalloregulator ArsR/SmtB family transcription factor [Cocleimonas sp.]|nr:metalloregulator ArsR/SmtB family transcription factor [Cocleimonas sp.]